MHVDELRGPSVSQSKVNGEGFWSLGKERTVKWQSLSNWRVRFHSKRKTIHFEHLVVSQPGVEIADEEENTRWKLSEGKLSFSRHSWRCDVMIEGQHFWEKWSNFKSTKNEKWKMKFQQKLCFYTQTTRGLFKAQKPVFGLTFAMQWYFF